MAFYQVHFLLSLSAVSLCVTTYSLAHVIRHRRSSSGRLATTGALTAFVSVLTLASLTCTADLVRTELTGDDPGFGLGFHLASFIAIYGGSFALAGAFIALIAYACVQRFPRVVPHPIHDGG